MKCSRGVLCLALSMVLASVSTEAAAGLRIKKPRITVGKPRVVIPAPKIEAPPIIREIPRIPGNVVRAADDVARDVSTTVGKALEDANREQSRAATNVAEATVKAHQDAYAETRRGLENANELGTATRKYLVSNYMDTKDVVSDANQRIREGKFADAFWHAAVDPLKDQEGRAAAYVQESSLANTAAATAASAYGGAAGAAAYSAWYTYRATGGDVELALKAGVISGATHAGLQATSGMAVSSDSAAAAAADVAKKAIVAGAIGGLAVAAGGGDDEAVREGFLRSGGMVLIQDGYREWTKGQDLQENLKAPKHDAYCSLANPAAGKGCGAPSEVFKKNPDGSIQLDAKGQPILDPAKLSNERSWLGMADDGATWRDDQTVLQKYAEIDFRAETHPIMNGIARIPGMNAMAIMHDSWVIEAPLSGWTNQATIVPAIVVTYLGTQAGIQTQIVEEVLKDQAAKLAASAAEPAAPAASQSEARTFTPASYLCTKGIPQFRTMVTRSGGFAWRTRIVSSVQTISRTVMVGRGTSPGEVACVVVYQKSDERPDDEAVWYALNDTNYCGPKAEAFVKSLQDEGWACMAR